MIDIRDKPEIASFEWNSGYTFRVMTLLVTPTGRRRGLLAAGYARPFVVVFPEQSVSPTYGEEISFEIFVTVRGR